MKALKMFQCQLEQNKFVLAEGEKLGEQQMFGVEFEYMFAPDTAKIACIAFLMNAGMLSYDDLRKQTLSSFGGNASILQMEPMKVDGENDELVLYPITLQAFKNLKPHFDILFASLHKQGYEPWGPMNEIGMHISVEKSLISPTAMSRVYWWLLENNELFVYLSGRKNWSTCRADIRFMLGDKHRKWTKNELKNRAEEQFQIAYDGFVYKFDTDIIGIRTYLSRPYVQFTQFGSTLKSETLLSTIEFMDWLLNWCDAKEDNDPQHFINSVQQNKYPYLYDTLKSLSL